MKHKTNNLVKKVVLTLTLISLGIGFSACEKNDYQHPMYRNR